MDVAVYPNKYKKQPLIEATKTAEVIVMEMILASLAIVTSLSVFYLPAGDNGSV